MRTLRTTLSIIPAALLAVIMVALVTPCLAITDQELADIRAAIKAQGFSWIAGHTGVSDLPISDLAGSILNPAAIQERELRERGLLPEEEFKSPLVLPATFDWRTYGGHDWTTPIRNQGGCGSCYIFGTCAAAEASMKAQSGGNGWMAQPNLAEQFILSCKGWSCASGYSGDTLTSLMNDGSTDDTCFPYTGLDTTPCGNRCANWSERLHYIDNWFHPNGTKDTGWDPTVNEIKNAIYNHGPVSTYMNACNDFQSYRGGVYQKTTSAGCGGHTVTLIGWIDSQSCWIGKNSWGTDWGETIGFQATSPGATDGGWFRIKWDDSSEIGYQTEYVQAGLPNLTDYPKAGWTYSLVPCNDNAGTWTSSTLPATLSGNTNTTYVNHAGINNGSENAPPFGSRIYIDGIYSWWFNFGVVGAGQGMDATNNGPFNIRGGRHTVGVDLDTQSEVWEKNEGDNATYRQFIWSPYNLPDASPQVRATPPDKSAWGNAASPWYNNDGFSFSAAHELSVGWWSVVGIIPEYGGSDFDLRLWDIGSYTGSETGFGPGYLQTSTYGSGRTDFVLVNLNMDAPGTYYAGAYNYNSGAGRFKVEHDRSEQIALRPGTQWNGPYAKNSNNVLDSYEVYLQGGQYFFLLDQTYGTADLGMSLFDWSVTTATKSGALVSSDQYGDGAFEYFWVNVGTAGWYGLVVWKSQSTDFDKEHTYRIAAGAPYFKVDAPNGGETWKIGDTATINWENFGVSAGTVAIEISRNGGSSWSTITASTPNDGVFEWPVTGPVSSQCRIRVSAGAYNDASDADFTIVQPSITVTAPDGGEIWYVGESGTITWTSQNMSGNVNIDLSRDGGSNWTNIAADTANDGTESWTTTGPTSGQCLVRVTSVSYAAAQDTSNNNFTIAARTITVTAPNGGESWKVRETGTITWSSQNVVGNVMIELSRDGGASWSTLLGTTANDGTEPWNVTGPGSALCRIRVSALGHAGVSDVSDADFTIVPPTITVVSPNGGQQWVVGKRYAIKWTYTGNPGTAVKIVLLRGGIPVKTLRSAYPVGSAGSGRWFWKIPLTQRTGKNYRIMITSTLDADCSDTSNANFTIKKPPLLVAQDGP